MRRRRVPSTLYQMFIRLVVVVPFIHCRSSSAGWGGRGHLPGKSPRPLVSIFILPDEVKDVHRRVADCPAEEELPIVGQSETPQDGWGHHLGVGVPGGRAGRAGGL